MIRGTSIGAILAYDCGCAGSQQIDRSIQLLVVTCLVAMDIGNGFHASSDRAIGTTVQSPPGNHLESLRGDRKGQHSIRINDQWRVCFTWKSGDAHEVEIVDYH